MILVLGGVGAGVVEVGEEEETTAGAGRAAFSPDGNCRDSRVFEYIGAGEWLTATPNLIVVTGVAHEKGRGQGPRSFHFLSHGFFPLHVLVW